MNTLRYLNEELASLASGVQRSLVRIVSGGNGVGAGTIWHPDGLIVTNAHVVGHGRRLQVVLPDKRVLPARVLAHSYERDLAALYVDATQLPAIPLGKSRMLKPGDFVMAMGHPWGIANGATGGVVIGVGRDFPELPPLAHDGVVANLRLRPGHSGGPLVDFQGHLVGVNMLMSGPEVGVAIAVDVVKEFLRQALGTPVPENVI
ncbi:MAG: trypsin-like peptidase domain-containing protein [Anaerolineae bacterium]|nr:trypsin-like peptidase domain-containing protein [Anaerolineae bacterium]